QRLRRSFRCVALASSRLLRCEHGRWNTGCRSGSSNYRRNDLWQTELADLVFRCSGRRVDLPGSTKRRPPTRYARVLLQGSHGSPHGARPLRPNSDRSVPRAESPLPRGGSRFPSHESERLVKQVTAVHVDNASQVYFPGTANQVRALRNLTLTI